MLQAFATKEPRLEPFWAFCFSLPSLTLRSQTNIYISMKTSFHSFPTEKLFLQAPVWWHLFRWYQLVQSNWESLTNSEQTQEVREWLPQYCSHLLSYHQWPRQASHQELNAICFALLTRKVLAEQTCTSLSQSRPTFPRKIQLGTILYAISPGSWTP